MATSSRTRVTPARPPADPTARPATPSGGGCAARISTSPPISDFADRATVRSRLSAKLPTPTSALTPSVMQARK